MIPFFDFPLEVRKQIYRYLGLQYIAPLLPHLDPFGEEWGESVNSGMVYVNWDTRLHWPLGYEVTCRRDSIVRAIHHHRTLPVQPSLYAVAYVAGFVKLSRDKKKRVFVHP